MPRTRRTMPSLFSQSVPNISSTSRDERNLSNNDGPVSVAANVGAGVADSGGCGGAVDAGGVVVSGAGSEALRVTQGSAAVCDVLGSSAIACDGATLASVVASLLTGSCLTGSCVTVAGAWVRES